MGLRVGICTSHFYPTRGGAEGQLLQLARCWALAGHTPVVFTRPLKGTPTREWLDGVEIRRVLYTVCIGPLFGLSFVGGLLAALWSEDFDVVLAGQGPWEAVATGMLARFRGVPTIARIANNGTYGDLAQMRRAKGAWLWRYFFLGNRRFLALSASAQDELLPWGCRKERIRVIPNGVDTRRFCPRSDSPKSGQTKSGQTKSGQTKSGQTKSALPESAQGDDMDEALDPTPRREPNPSFSHLGEGESSSPNPMDVLFVGRFTAQKDPGCLLNAWQKVEIAFPHARLLLAGIGPDESLLRERISIMKLTRVIFLGNVADMPARYQSASVVVLPSHGEGCSNALLEAMASGCAVVVSDIPENRALVRDGDNGLTFPVGNAARLADAIMVLLASSMRRRQLGQAARMRMEQSFQMERVAEAYLRLFKEVRRG